MTTLHCIMYSMCFSSGNHLNSIYLTYAFTHKKTYSKIQTSDTDITIVRSTVNCASQADNVNVSCEDTT